MIRYPRLLTPSLGEYRRLSPVSYSLTLSVRDASQASMVLSDNEQISMHSWVELYTPHGSAGIFRVTGIEHTYLKQVNVTLLHGIDVLSDQIYPGEVEYSGTVSGFIQDVLSKQTRTIGGTPFWTLGTCEDTGSYRASVQYDDLRSLLRDLIDHEQDFYFTYDQTTFPWTINVARKNAQICNEFRLARNISSCSITLSDAEMCNRLHLQIDADTANASTGVTTTATTYRTYNDTTSQATYGIISKTVSINTADFPNPDTFAQRYMADRNRPRAQISIDGIELYRITGDTFDELKLGRLCRVALPDYGDTFDERIISIQYPDLISDPDRVRVDMANSAYSAVSSISSIASSARSTAKALSSTSKTVSSQIHSAKADLIETDGILHEAGLEIDPTGVFMFAKAQGALGQSMSFVDVTATGGRTMFTDAFEKDANGKLVVKSASGMSYRKNNVEVGLFDNDNLTAGIMIRRINGGSADDSEVIIKASKVDLGAYATVGRLEAEIAQIESLYATNASVAEALAGNISCMSLGASTVSGDSVSGSLATFASCVVNGYEVGDSTIHKGTPTASVSGGSVTITFPTMGGSTSVNFNIADTQVYQDAVSAAYTSGYTDGEAAGKMTGWNAAASLSGVNANNSVTFPRSGSYGSIIVKSPRITGYVASSYSKESVSYTRSYHSHTASSYTKETTVNRDGVTVLVSGSSYTKESDSYSPSYYSYTASSYSASSPGSISWS